MTLTDQEYELVEVGALRPHPDNPRQGNVAAIHDSITANGFYGAVIAQAGSMRIIAGEHRWLAAQDAGLSHVPALVLEVDDAMARRIMLADNRATDLATYDYESLAAVLAEVATDDLAGTGYTEDDLATLAGLPALGVGGEGDATALALDDDSDAPERERGVPQPDDPYGAEAVREEAVAHLQAQGFPYRDVPRYQAMLALNALAQTPDEALVRTTRAMPVADTYHRHRYGVRVGDRPTALETWEADLPAVVAWLHGVGRMSGPYTVADGVFLYGRTQTARNFRAGYTLALLRRFCPPGGTVLDTSMGYGGRLLGFYASDAQRYIGLEPASQTYAANRRLVADLCPAGKVVEQYQEPVEDVAHSRLAGQADVAITCPPYYRREQYAPDEPTQSHVRYRTPQAWREGFLRPMLALHHAALRPGAYDVVVVGDVPEDYDDGSATLPLVDWVLEDAAALGLAPTATEQYPTSRRFHPKEGAAVPDHDTALILRKPLEAVA